MDESDQLDTPYHQIESPAGRITREMREAHKRDRERNVEFHGANYSDGADGSRTVLIPYSDGGNGIPPFTGYGWIAQAPDGTGEVDLAFGNISAGFAGPASIAIRNLSILVGDSALGAFLKLIVGLSGVPPPALEMGLSTTNLLQLGYFGSGVSPMLELIDTVNGIITLYQDMITANDGATGSITMSPVPATTLNIVPIASATYGFG